MRDGSIRTRTVQGPPLEADPAAWLAWAVIVVLSLAHGGGYSSAWSATAIAMAAVGAFVTVRARPRIGPRAAAVILILVSLAGWSALSSVWSADRPATAGEVGRWAAMAGFLAVACLVARAATTRGLLLGTSMGAATVCAIALAARVLPGSLGGPSAATINRLTGPLGYWNALGELAAIGLLLACGLLVGAERRAAAYIAASAVPMTAALYLTFSRGALLALLCGLVVVIALQRERLHAVVWMAALLPGAALAIALLDTLPALSAAHPQRQSLQEQSALAVAMLAGVACVAALLASRWQGVVDRALGSAPARRRTRVIAIAAAGIVIVVPLVAAGPAAIVRGLSSSGAPAPQFRHGDLNLRLLSLSSNGRSDIWHVAWRDAVSHPVIGSGDGTFAQRWLRDRAEDVPAVAAHSLVLETAAELGLVGLVLLGALMAVPLSAAARLRSSPLMCAAAGAVAGPLVQMSIDWTWDVTAVTCAFLACVAALSVEADRSSDADLGWVRGLLGVAAVVVVAVAALALTASFELWHAERALRAGHPVLAANRAGTAGSLAPWSARPLQVESYAWGRAHRPKQALAAAQRGVARAPHEWWFWFRLACNDTGRARRADLAQARRLNPLAPEVRRFPRRCGEPLP